MTPRFHFKRYLRLLFQQADASTRTVYTILLYTPSSTCPNLHNPSHIHQITPLPRFCWSILVYSLLPMDECRCGGVAKSFASVIVHGQTVRISEKPSLPLWEKRSSYMVPVQVLLISTRLSNLRPFVTTPTVRLHVNYNWTQMIGSSPVSIQFSIDKYSSTVFSNLNITTCTCWNNPSLKLWGFRSNLVYLNLILKLMRNILRLQYI